MKKILSIVLCLVMICPCASLAYADTAMENEIALEWYSSYANSIIPDLANLPDVTLPASLYISQPLAIHGENVRNTYAIFMFDQNTCIGILLISYVTDRFFASFLYCEMPAVSAAYIDSTPFYLLSSNGMLLMCATTTEIIVGKTEENIQVTSTTIQYQTAEAYSGIRRELLALTLASPTVTPRYSGLPNTSAILDVPFVENAKVNGEGLCWAAGAASIIRFLTNNNMVSATDIYYALASSGPPPVGTYTNVLRSLYVYGVQNYIAESSAVSFVYFTQQINAGYPVFLSIVGTSYTLPVYHGVVVCGYLCENDGADYIQIVDSNVPEGKIWLTVDRSANTFVYNIDFATSYTTWAWSVCAVLEE